MFSIKSVYITAPHESHNTILCLLASMVHVSLRRSAELYQIQIRDKNTSYFSTCEIYVGQTPLSSICYFIMS